MVDQPVLAEDPLVTALFGPERNVAPASRVALVAMSYSGEVADGKAALRRLGELRFEGGRVVVRQQADVRVRLIGALALLLWIAFCLAASRDAWRRVLRQHD